MNIPDRLAALERRLGPSDQRAQETEEIGRRLVNIVNNIDPERDREAFEALREALRAVLPGRRQQQR
jgi:hypothetical protein